MEENIADNNPENAKLVWDYLIRIVTGKE